MDEDIAKLIDAHIPGIAERWEELEPLFKREVIHAKTILLREGDVARRMYFTPKGCIRLFFNDFKKDVTLRFFFEDSFVCSLESFLEHKPSRFGLETVETGVYYWLSREDHARLIRELPLYEAHFNFFFRRRMYYYMDSLLDYIRFSPEQRYQALLKDHPELLQRIPQYYIASYLGITAVSYSRIRNRR